MLSQTASNRAIERLKRNPNIENWVRQGLSLHKDVSICEFCGAPLTEARLEELRGHFSEEYEKLVEELDGKLEYIKAINLSPAIYDEMLILPDFRQSFTSIKTKFLDWVQWTTDLCNQLIDAINQKKLAIESQLKLDVNLIYTKEGEHLLKEINQIIESHNKTVSSIHNAKNEAKIALERHYAATYYLENEIAKKENEITQMTKYIRQAEKITARIKLKIQEIEKKIKQLSVGATKLNELLRYLLPGNKIEVVSVGDVEFQFRRDGNIAMHLSEGEKTAITFAYFLTSLEANGASLANTIVFIDDPVSSLDSNHIYAVYALITGQLEKSKQLFVATHNAELFNLLKSNWLGRNGGNREDSRAYYVHRTIDSSGEPFATFCDLPSLLRRFKSEYEFIFSQLYQFAEKKTASLYETYTIPNLLRKFLEAYLGFRKPSVREWAEKLNLLFDIPEYRCEIQRFLNDASHLQSLNRLLCQVDFASNAQRCVWIVLDALKNKDRDHYNSLCEISKETWK